jgi:hypothetical protein
MREKTPAFLPKNAQWRNWENGKLAERVGFGFISQRVVKHRYP